MKKYFEEISILRGVAILLVLLGHSIIVGPINLLEVPWCKTLYDYIYYFHMPLFFLISGFCYRYENNYSDYVTGKVRRILIPYMVFSIIDLIPRHLFPSLINGNSTLKDDILSIFLYGGQYWFLYVLFIIFLIYPAIYRVKNKYAICFILIGLATIHFANITDMFLLNVVIAQIFYFMLGNLLKNIYSNKFKRTMSKPYIVLIMFALFIIVGLIPNNPMIKIIKTLIGCIMAYSFAVFIKSDKVKSFLKSFGNYSLQLYLLNGFILVPSRIITVKVLHITNPLFIICIIFILNTIIGILMSKYIIDKANIFRLLCGIKTTKKQMLTL